MDVRARLTGDTTARSGITFAEVAEQWMEEQIAAVKAGLKRRSTLQTNVYQLKPLLDFFAPLDLEEVTRMKVMEYQSLRRERDALVAETINSETSRLKQILGWAREQKLCRSVAKFPSLKVRQTPPDLPTLEEIAKIVGALPEQNALLVRLLIETGCRPGEAYGLNWEDIDFQRATIRFQPSEERGLKSPQSERNVHVSDELAQDLKRFRRGHSGFVFRGRGGGPVTDFGKSLRTAVVKAGVTRRGQPIKVTAKSFRKSHGTLQMMRRTPETLVQTRMGHVRGSRTLQKYYVWAEQHADKDAVMALPKAEWPKE
ncbi:MAG: hypothetical protein RIR33_3698 [Pseudomonadota bacterium]